MAAVSTPEKTRTSFVAAERERRLAKLDALRERGIEPYPGRFDRDATIGVLYAAAEGFLDVPVIGPLLTPKPA